MSTQSLALSAAGSVSEEDYQAFLTVLSASSRGRAFLDEHARRHREADTAALREAIERLEARFAAQPSKADIAQELNALIESVQSVRSQIDAVQLTAAVTQLAATLDGIQQRLSGLVAEPPSRRVAAETKPEPQPVQPPFALALSAVAAQAIAAAQDDEEPIKVLKAGTIPPPAPFAGEDFASQDAHARPAEDFDSAAQATVLSPLGTGEDAMAALMALSEEERLALFS